MPCRRMQSVRVRIALGGVALGAVVGAEVPFAEAGVVGAAEAAMDGGAAVRGAVPPASSLPPQALSGSTSIKGRAARRPGRKVDFTGKPLGTEGAGRPRTIGDGPRGHGRNHSDRQVTGLSTR